MIYKKIFFLNLVRPAVSMDRLTGRHRTGWSPRGGGFGTLKSGFWGGRARRSGVPGWGGPSDSRPPTPPPDPMAQIPKNDGFGAKFWTPKKANF